MDYTITANELKTRGVSAIKEVTANYPEAVITVRGESRYVVIPIESYNRLRECELEAAIIESRMDVRNGRYIQESVDDHIKRLKRG